MNFAIRRWGGLHYIFISNMNSYLDDIMIFRHFKRFMHLATTIAKILLTNQTTIRGFSDFDLMTFIICFADVTRKTFNIQLIQCISYFCHTSHKEIFVYTMYSISWNAEFLPTNWTWYFISRFHVSIVR